MLVDQIGGLVLDCPPFQSLEPFQLSLLGTANPLYVLSVVEFIDSCKRMLLLRILLILLVVKL